MNTKKEVLPIMNDSFWDEMDDDYLISTLEDVDMEQARSTQASSSLSSSAQSALSSEELLAIKVKISPITVMQPLSPHGFAPAFQFFPSRSIPSGLKPAEARQRRKTILSEKRALRASALLHKPAFVEQKIKKEASYVSNRELTHLSKQEKNERRRLKNLESAKASRQKRESRLTELNYSMALLMGQNQWFLRQNEILFASFSSLIYQIGIHDEQTENARISITYLTEQERHIDVQLIALPAQFERDFTDEYQELETNSASLNFDERRKIRNRMSANISRQRKIDKIFELEASLSLLTSRRDMLEQIHQLLSSENTRLNTLLMQYKNVPMHSNHGETEEEHDCSLSGFKW
jgi:hypothetical protein